MRTRLLRPQKQFATRNSKALIDHIDTSDTEIRRVNNVKVGSILG